MFAGLHFFILPLCWALSFDSAQVGWNLNENQVAQNPLDYSGTWDDHEFFPSPSNWRFPFYVITPDRFIDGDPTNNEANGTQFEHEWLTNQYRFGGDVRGLKSRLDYLQGMGIKGLYLAGSPFINQPWSGDGYGPLDFTLLDRHHGQIQDWRDLIDDIHSRGMYIILDNTLATMGDLLSFEGYVNASAPFNWNEYDVLWKSDRRYHDFTFSNDLNNSCVYPRMWEESGLPINQTLLDSQKGGCKASEFDAYGDMKGVGEFPAWQSQLSKFASVQDRLRAWPGSEVLEKLKHFSCMQITMLDIDGFRMDKALQTIIDSQAEFSSYQKECARQIGKNNFLVVGEVVGEIPISALYFGRGKTPDQSTKNNTAAMLATNETNPDDYLRSSELTGLDGAAFHYPTYGALTRFLGLDGPIGFEGVDWVDHWSAILNTDDLVNGLTGTFDPRHMFGATNQDVFRWPSLANGTQRQLLGLFVTTLIMPGIPMVLWGEEQQFNVLENLASDYVFGRSPMGSSAAWQLHGCYHLDAQVYVDMPFDSAREACQDDNVSKNHLDPSHPLRNILKRMFELRQQFPTLNDGYSLDRLSTKLQQIYLPGSGNISSPTGLWSVYRGRAEGVQDLTLAGGQGNQGVWLLYSNQNTTMTYQFDCTSPNNTEALISAFPAGSTVRNLFYPYETIQLEASVVTLEIENSTEPNGCLSSLEMRPWEFKAFVPEDKFVTPAPTITKFVPGHDARLVSNASDAGSETLPIELHFSSAMDCDYITDNLRISSTTEANETAVLDKSSVLCTATTVDDITQDLVSQIGTAWTLSGQLTNVFNGIHSISIYNATTEDGVFSTGANDSFIFRIGALDNPVVFPTTANYTTDLLYKDDQNGSLWISHRAAGADLWRYSLNWGSSWSNWTIYEGGNTTLAPQPWSGTDAQRWVGDHVVLQYWSEKAGSGEHIQHSDASSSSPARRFPHLHVQGVWNQYGYDAGLSDSMQLSQDNWTFELMSEWPTKVILNVWGMNPDGLPDKTRSYGDIDGDHVLDLVPPDSLSDNVLKMDQPPGMPYTSWKLEVNDGNLSYRVVPSGSAPRQIAIFVLLALVPILCACAATWAFWYSFYQVKHNKIGVVELNSLGAFSNARHPFQRLASRRSTITDNNAWDNKPTDLGLTAAMGSSNRRTVLIATMEYEIEDWDIKIKIGGLGVMANLMGKNLGHQNLIWVVPCVGGIDYPTDTPGDDMVTTIMGKEYRISVQYHVTRNITFVLLDAPVFRQQTKKDPYPARMDDLESAIYYSAWNSCIAETIKRFPSIDLYHINDYHGALAPLYLLPRVIPVCLSLHNAEFQGLWPVRNSDELDEISRVFNLDKQVIQEYVQFGEIFNLLHAGASYLRVHQKGFGAVGVSKKYGKRSLARYPIFWGLSRIGALPNPDPSDTAEWSRDTPVDQASKKLTMDFAAEAKRGELRIQAQKWAGLKEDPQAELFVFVGRWSMQKGIDAIADVFPAILEKNKNVQLICIGPVIDLYGKFAALKLSKLMAMYPDRVFSKPEFTQLPPYIFSGAEFALIPSRDEPFGLVAVEFGRKGALGVGARVGGLGQMPGFWFTIESTSTKHLLSQFKSAIKAALATDVITRAGMRARSSVQRFPVAQWVEDLEKLQNTSINKHRKVAGKKELYVDAIISSAPTTALTTAANSPAPSRHGSRAPSPSGSRPASPTGSIVTSTTPLPARNSVDMAPSFGQVYGPGHERASGTRLRRSRSAMSLQDSQLLNPNQRDRSMEIHDIDASSIFEHPPSIAEYPESPALDLDDPLLQRKLARASTIDVSHVFPPLKNWERTQSPHSSLLFARGRPRDSPQLHRHPAPSLLSLREITGSPNQENKEHFNLEHVDPFFQDSTEFYYNKFDSMLNSLDAQNSEGKYCIEDYLNKSEKDWFNRFHQAKLGKTKSRPGTATSHITTFDTAPDSDDIEKRNMLNLLGDDYQPPVGTRKFLQYKIGDWPLYAFLLALGQILAANSYQITLIAGQNGQSATDLYVIASIYLVSTILWWTLFRRIASVYVLSSPFILYGLAFLFLGVAPFASTPSGIGWIQNVATGIYAVASASGSLFFALNFGSEGGTSVRTWAFRACVVQGTQQIYISVLWWWGGSLSRLTTGGAAQDQLVLSTPRLTIITAILCLALWVVGVLLFLGLPNFYRSTPGVIPSFYSSAYRRKIILWFLVVVIIQNYFLSTQYGRNWQYLWSSTIAPGWSIVLLLIFFFVFVWAVALFVLGRLSVEHSWILPIFAIGIGAPRWCQMLWGTSGMGVYLPWVTVGAYNSHASLVASAVLGRALWLWLGVLDSLQGVGFGMILLQTLTRMHIAFTLMAAQVLGSAITIAARASAPNKDGPANVFPNLATDSSLQSGIHAWDFWLCLILQMSCCVGFFMFFRKEQLFKP